MRLARALLAAALLAAILPAAHAAAQEIAPGQIVPNLPQARTQHYVILLSLDGFRWDYAKRDGARALLDLGKRGASAPEGMLPSYPAQAFPNHVTIVTGLYPGRHGIVADSFFDPERNARFSASDPQSAADGSWYSGTPLWSLAESHGMRTACIDWPGCAAKIAGFRPAYALQPGVKTSPAGDIRQALAWLRPPAAERPHFIAMYEPEPGQAARRYGPDAPQTRAAVQRMDAFVATLKAGLDATRLPIDLVVVSGNGLVKTEGNWITLDRFTDLSSFETASFETAGPLLYAKTEEARTHAYNQLKRATSEFVAYRLKNLPAGFHMFQNPREGDPVVVATGAYALRAHGPQAGEQNVSPPLGIEGLDPRIVPEMKAIFFAAGPDIVKGRAVAPFENVNLYPWLAHLLGLTPPKNDGSFNILWGTLRDGAPDEPVAEGAAQQ